MKKEYNFKKCYEQYLLYCSNRLKASTMKQKTYKFGVMTELYDSDIRKLTNTLISKWTDRKIEESTKKYVNSLIKELRAFLSWCIKNKLISDNEAKLVDLYTVPKTVQTWWEVSEYKEFINFVENKTDRLMFDILFYTGIRSGELTALTPAKFENGIMRIDETYDIQVRQVTSTKNNKVRNCLLPAFLDIAINEYIKENNIKENEFLFARCSAHRLRHEIYRICDEHKLKPIKLHGLRHSCVSMLIEQKFSVLDICNYICHSNPSITWDVYSHMYKDKMKEIKNKLEEINEK